MEVEFTVLTRRGAAVMRKSQRASGDRIRLGRGTDNEVPLYDIRVGLRVAALVPLSDGIGVENLSQAPLLVNGEARDSSPLHPGDVITVGPYRIELVAPPEGCDGAIQIELVQEEGSLERVTAGARIGLERTSANKRVYSWSGFLVLAVLSFVLPIVVYTSGIVPAWKQDPANPHVDAPKLVSLSWNPGEISNSHKFFSANCSTCHENAFVRVADKACLGCHTKVGSHVDAKADLGRMHERVAEMRCVDCHTEHRGLRGSVIRTEGLCLDCHRDLDKTAPGADVQAITGYPDGHKPFRVTVVTDAVHGQTKRVALDSDPPPLDQPGIKFSHAVHLVKGGFRELNYPEMTCDKCHRPEPSGQGFLPITYKEQCQDCHKLTFAKTAMPWPDATVPHGDDEGVVKAIWTFFAAQALDRGLPMPATPSAMQRAAGVAPPAPSAMPADTRAWIAQQTRSALRDVLLDDARGGCAYCHFGLDGKALDPEKVLAMVPPAQPGAGKFIGAVRMPQRFLPNAQFDHSQHRGMVCADCHASRYSLSPSEALALDPRGVGEILVPDLQNCTKCHGPENARLRARSTCVTCHVFHRDERGPMHMSAETAQ